MIYRKLKRVWSHNEMNDIAEFRKMFPELDHISREEMFNRWLSLGIDFYTEEEDSASALIRLSLPFAFILIALMFLSLPFVFIFTGKWGYGFSEENWIYNWFDALF